MKTIIIFLLIIATTGMAQNQTAAFKHCNTIKIKTDLSIRQMVDVLQSNGYSVASYDRELGIIKTGPFKIWKNWSHTATMEIWENDGFIMVSAYAFASQWGTSTTWKMEKVNKGNVKGKLFDKVDQFTNKIDGDKYYLYL